MVYNTNKSRVSFRRNREKRTEKTQQREFLVEFIMVLVEKAQSLPI